MSSLMVEFEVIIKCQNISQQLINYQCENTLHYISSTQIFYISSGSR